MAIDPRISLQVSPLTNVTSQFSEVLRNLKTQDELQAQRQAQPFRQELLELGTELQRANQPALLQQAQIASSPESQFLSEEAISMKIKATAAQRLQPFLDSGNLAGLNAELDNAINTLTSKGVPQSLVAPLFLAKQKAQTPEGFQQLKQETESFLQSAGVTPRTPAQTASQRDFQTFKDLEKQAKLTPETEDDIAAQQFGRQAGFVRPTEQEKADIKVSESERKEVAKANAKRKQGFIDAGVEAADSVANIKRSIELLETVKTGGIDQAKFRIRQAFGIEGADEGELSANLGRSVLAQLKPIFGAAFTAAEGERLERIEAGFGRSPDTNKRLLNSALRIAERASRRGLAAAEDQGDEFTANEIREAMAFKFEDPSETPEQPPAPSAFQEGQTATNPQTGERLIFRNGNWEAL